MPGLSKAKELREQRAQLCSRMKEITESPAGEDKSLSAEQRAEFDKIHERQEALKADIERTEQAEALEQEMAESRGVKAGKRDDAGDGTEDRSKPEERVHKERVAKAFDSYLRNGLAEMEPEERALIKRRFQRPTEERAQSTGIDTAGGYLVPDEFQNQVIEARAFYGGMRSTRATILTTASGNPLYIPTDDDTGNSGSLIGENVQSSETSLTFGQVRLNAYTYRTGIVLVSLELMQDSAIDLSSFIAKKFGRRLGKITNTHFTTGDGASKPYGIAAQSTEGQAGATGQTTTILYDDLVELEHSVDREYRQNAEWMMSDTMLQTLKQLKDGEGRPLWVPGLAVREPDRILGYPYVVNGDVAVPAASAKSLFFGDFASYYIRDVQGIMVRRLDERYADFNQVGFIAFSRHDGRHINAGTEPIKHYAHPAA